MKKELRIYVINVNKVDFDVINLTDSHFMDIAEEQGTVYTVESFTHAFNISETIKSDCMMLRFIEVEIEEPVKTLYYHVYPNENNDEYKDINVYEIKLDKLVYIINIETRIENESEIVILDYILINDLPDLKYKLELI